MALRVAVVVLLLAGLCAAEAKAYPTALAALESDKNLTLFTKVAEIAGIRPYLNSTKTRATIFAPSNDAIIALATAFNQTPEGLIAFHNHLLVDRLIGYHVITRAGNLKAAAVKDGLSLTTSSKGKLTLSAKAGAVAVKGPHNSANVTATDLIGGNVTIHVIDAVLLPHTVFPSLAAALAYSPVVSKLAGFIAKDPKLAAAAADPSTNVTLFAPTDKALTALAATPAAKAIIGNSTSLHALLAYHAAKGAIVVPPFKGQGTKALPTLLPGESIKVTKVYSKKGNATTGVVEVLGSAKGAKAAQVKAHNIIAGASFVNVINGVLVPAKL